MAVTEARSANETEGERLKAPLTAGSLALLLQDAAKHLPTSTMLSESKTPQQAAQWLNCFRPGWKNC
jgi:hypothetical protein